MYLVATAWSYSEAYQYALHRFVSVEILDEPIVRPNGYDLDRYIQEQDAFAYPKSDKILNLVVEFEAAAMAQLRERPLSDCQLTKDLPNGWVRVSAAVKDTAELRWWLRSYGPSVRIMKPAALRAEFKKEAKTSVQHYELPDY